MTLVLFRRDGSYAMVEWVGHIPPTEISVGIAVFRLADRSPIARVGTNRRGSRHYYPQAGYFHYYERHCHELAGFSTLEWTSPDGTSTGKEPPNE